MKPAADFGICVVGVGAITPVGASARASWAALRAGLSAFEEHPFLVDKSGHPMVLSRASFLPDGSPLATRLEVLASQAACAAMAPLNSINGASIGSIPMFLGLPAPRPGLDRAMGERFAAQIQDGLRGPRATELARVEMVGHAAGMIALHHACNHLMQGTSDFCLAGAVDSYIDRVAVEWVDFQDQLHSRNNPWGFVPGEAAGFVLLATPPVAARFPVPALGMIRGIASAMEPNRIKTDTVCTGQGLTEAVRHAIAPLPAGVKVDEVYCDINGERYRAEEWGFTIPRITERFADASLYESPAACWGDVGAASGPVFISLAITGALAGHAAGTTALIWTSSESGERSAALLQLFPAEPWAN